MSAIPGLDQTIDSVPTRERWLWALAAVLIVLAIALPPLAQDPAYHAFADTRTLLGLPNAMDVLSNLFFFVLGSWGLVRHLRGGMAYPDATMRRAAVLFFAGFLLTGAGSSYYHLQPDDARLVWDRFGMVVAFAGVIGLAAADRLSPATAKAMLPLALVCGVASVAWFRATGSVTPYAVMQFGGIAWVAASMCFPSRGSGPNWGAMIASYALAKAFELGDAQVFALSGGRVSGHTLKHIFAALAALAVLGPLWRRRTAVD